MTARRWYVLMAVASLAFIAFGSFVPFEFHARPLGTTLEDFAWVLQNRLRVESRSDLAANVLLGMPLGFGLLGAFRVDRPGVRPAVRTGLAILPGCVLYAALVEFVQLFIVGRTSSSIDIVAQGVGATAGMAGWLLTGQRLTDAARRVGGPAGWVLLAYLGLIAFTQLLPLDLSASPYRVHRKLIDGRTTLVPFGEWRSSAEGPEPDRGWFVAVWLVSAALLVPAGVILAHFPGWFWQSWRAYPAVLVLGFTLGLALEAGQLLVSRHPSVTDAVMMAAGLVIGWSVGRLGFVKTGGSAFETPATGRRENSV